MGGLQYFKLLRIKAMVRKKTMKKPMKKPMKKMEVIPPKINNTIPPPNSIILKKGNTPRYIKCIKKII